jgi:threonine dehydrogenase-like Zn-dependent dehydrogenase
VDGQPLFLRELTVTASYAAGPGDMRAALDLLRAGTVDPAPLVTHRLPLEETGRAFALARSGEALKAVVVPSVL